MYYLSRGLKERGFKRFGKFLGILFAILCVGASFGGGNAFQTNQAAAQIVTQFDIQGDASGTIVGIVFAILVGIVIIGGIKRIAKVTEKIVPFMAAIYVIVILFIIFSNFSYIDDAIALIFKEAFTPRATITGGFIGVMIQGFRRAAFSNEAGAGSAAIAHSAVNTKYAASEGLVGLLEPFIDTVVICSLTAITIIMFNIDGAFNYGDVVNGSNGQGVCTQKASKCLDSRQRPPPSYRPFMSWNHGLSRAGVRGAPSQNSSGHQTQWAIDEHSLSAAGWEGSAHDDRRESAESATVGSSPCSTPLSAPMALIRRIIAVSRP